MSAAGGRSVGLDDGAARIVETVQQLRVVGEIFVDRLALTLVVTVVVDDQHTAHGKARPEYFQPYFSDAQKIAPALAAGNAVLLKPALWTPLVSLPCASSPGCWATALPTALFSVLPGAAGRR